MISKNFNHSLFPQLCSGNHMIVLSKVAGFVFMGVSVILVFSCVSLFAEVFKNNIFISNYPNPFDSKKTSTNIVVKRSPDIKNLTLKIYDLFGNPVRQFEIDREIVEWDGRNERGEFVAKGGYLCIVMTESGLVSGIRKIGVIH